MAPIEIELMLLKMTPEYRRAFEDGYMTAINGIEKFANEMRKKGLFPTSTTKWTRKSNTSSSTPIRRSCWRR